MVSPAQIKSLLSSRFPMLTTKPLNQGGLTGWSWWYPSVSGRRHNRVFYAVSSGSDGWTYVKCPQSARLSGNRAVTHFTGDESEIVRLVEKEIKLYLGS